MDRRDAMAMNPPDTEGFDESTMKWTVTIEVEQDDDTLEEVPVVFDARFEVCGTCQGKGKHTNPSIDAHGITREEFDEDPDFRENYFSGLYDVQCYECHGRRVVPELVTENLTDEQKHVLEVVERRARIDAECDRMSYLERMMGA